MPTQIPNGISLFLLLLLTLIGSIAASPAHAGVTLPTDASTVDHFLQSSAGSSRASYRLLTSAGTSRVVADSTNSAVTAFDYRLTRTDERLVLVANSYAAREAGNAQSNAVVSFTLDFEIDEPMIYRLGVQRTAAQALYFALGETGQSPLEVYLGLDAERYRTEDHSSQGTLTAGDYSLVSLNQATELNFPTIPGNESQVAYNFQVHAADATAQPIPEPLTILATILALGFGLHFRRMTVAASN